MRIYAKLSRRQGLWWDDHILIASWVSSNMSLLRCCTDIVQVLLLMEAILTQMGQLLGFGKKTVDIDPNNVLTIALYTSIGASVSCFASTFSKISFGVTLLRLTTGPIRWFVWFCVVSLFLIMLPSAFNTWIQCTPTAKAWNSTLEGKCWDPKITVTYGIFNAAWCAVADFALALLPWTLIWGLQMRTREKIGVGIAMSMGILYVIPPLFNSSSPTNTIQSRRLRHHKRRLHNPTPTSRLLLQRQRRHHLDRGRNRRRHHRRLHPRPARLLQRKSILVQRLPRSLSRAQHPQIHRDHKRHREEKHRTQPHGTRKG